MKSNFPVEIKRISDALRSTEMMHTIRSVLPPSIKIDKFTEVTLAGIANNPDVLDADRDSLYQACISAARRGLLPDKREGALVVYHTNVGTREKPQWMAMVQFMPMVEGIIKEMAKAGIDAYAVAVYENDTIALWNDDAGQHVKHEPLVFGEQGKMIGVFAAAKTKEGRTYVEAMNLRDIQQVASRSKQNSKTQNGVAYGGTWKSDFDRMAQKSALHRLRKRLPIVDEDALQNIKDMEEMSDIQTEAAGQPESEVAASPAPEVQQALPAPKVDEIDLKKIRTPRRSRVLEEVVQQNTATRQQAVQEKAEKADAAPLAAKTPEQKWSDVRDDDIV